MSTIRSHKDLIVYQASFGAAVEIFNASVSFPKEEKFSLTDQIRRSSRSVSANLAEAFRKRRYEKAFVAKLTDAEGEAAETLRFGLISALLINILHKRFMISSLKSTKSLLIKFLK